MPDRRQLAPPGIFACFIILLLLPPSGCAAGQYKSGFGDRKSDFLSFYVTAEFWYDFGAHHVGENRRSQAGGLGVDEEEQRVIG